MAEHLGPAMLPSDDDPLQEACGLAAIYAPGHDVARLIYFALYALQHRGQESAGITTSNQQVLTTIRNRGLVAQVFNEQSLRSLPGDLALGHVRYSTTGGGHWENIQPLSRNDTHPLALAHNGNLIDAQGWRQRLADENIALRGSSDSEIIAALISTQQTASLSAAVAQVMPELKGAYSAAVIGPKEIIAFRDPWGFRPLSLGALGPHWMVASESCAFDIVGAEFIRHIQPGEMVTINHRGMSSEQVVSASRRAHCLFEDIYFARPDSLLADRRVQQARGRMGELLWQRAPVEADIVIPVPDSGAPAARGLSRASGIPEDDGLIKNRYVARTFIQPGQELRQRGLRIKFNPLPEIVAGKRLIVVDDSIVRGNTTKQIVAMLRQAGAQEVHLRISSPAVKYGCHYGVDMSDPEEMIANHGTPTKIAQLLGADSLAYLSLEDVYKALGVSGNNYCAACFNGHYPLQP